MLEIALSFFIGAVLGLGTGYIMGRRKFSKQTAVQVIENLKATAEIKDITYEEQKSFLSQKITDLKIENRTLLEENIELKKQ